MKRYRWCAAVKLQVRGHPQQPVQVVDTAFTSNGVRNFPQRKDDQFARKIFLFAWIQLISEKQEMLQAF
ncbi:MAG: hypothetical protein WAK29_00555 [Terriglobales bacterium]